jgi:F1F0 ATPase subunit 2
MKTMMSNVLLQGGLALAIGMGVAWLYFGALWITLQRLVENVSAKRTVALLVLSYIGRLGLALVAFYWLAMWGIGFLVVGVTGFTLVALVLTATRARSGA